MRVGRDVEAHRPYVPSNQPKEKEVALFMSPRGKIIRATLSTLAIAWTASASAATYNVGPGQVFSTPATINWSQIRPGDVITIQPGVYSTVDQSGNSMTISGVAGTSASPILINAIAGQMPQLLNGIAVTNSSKYIKIDGLDVTRNAQSQPYAAIVIQGKSSNITVSHSNVHDAHVGINISHAGLDNQLVSNQIYDNVHHGITLGPSDSSITPAANTQSATFNTIRGNGMHGVEITGPYWNVSSNTISANGVSNAGGTSGIHLFSTGAGTNTPGGCNNNIVSYNYVSGQIDTALADGNGIQVDDFCDSNKVSYNVVWSNDGAGISLLTGYGNLIFANTSYSNARDSTRASKYPGVVRGEIVLSSSANICDNVYVNPAFCVVPAGRASNNVIYDNLVYSSNALVPGIYVSQDFLDQSRNTNHLYPNLYYNSTPTNGINLTWGSSNYFSASDIDYVTNLTASGGGNIVEAPSFSNPSNPSPTGTGSNGLRLSSAPSKQGWTINPATADMLGTMPTGSTYYFGAYYFNP